MKRQRRETREKNCPFAFCSLRNELAVPMKIIRSLRERCWCLGGCGSEEGGCCPQLTCVLDVIKVNILVVVLMLAFERRE